jgi:ACS family tartrate transporter-like MFS transporter
MEAEERATISKVTWRLVPFLCFLYFIAFIDRTNVSVAALTMNADLAFTAQAFGFGAGIFFIGYFLFEVPSNLALRRYGARRWIARIMVSWGIVSMAMAFVQGELSFYVLRFLLGVAEAGFFPGIILYLTWWFPNRVRAGILGLFILANPISTVLGAPLSVALLEVELFGLAGWQTLFLVEGLPAVLFGIVVYYKLYDSPAEAPWLTDRERTVLARAIERDQPPQSHATLKEGLLSAQVWLFTLIYAGLMLGVYGFGFWAPQIIKSAGAFQTNGPVAWILAFIYTCGALAMCLWGRHSDRTGERHWHLALPIFVGAVGLLYGGFASSLPLAIAAFTVGAMGFYASLPVFWTVPTAVLTGSAAAGGIALINSIGNLSGFLGPVVVGRLKDSTGGYAAGLYFIAASLALAGVMAILVGRRSRTLDYAP